MTPYRECLTPYKGWLAPYREWLRRRESNREREKMQIKAVAVMRRRCLKAVWEEGVAVVVRGWAGPGREGNKGGGKHRQSGKF